MVVGRIGRPHGVRGELTVEVRTDDPGERFAAGRVLRTEPADRGPLTVVTGKLHSGRWVLSFTGVEDRGDAEALRDTLLFVDPAELPPIEDPDEFYDHQLVGLAVVLLDGVQIGAVLDILHGPAGDLLVVDHDGQELLVPFRREVVPTVDLDAGRVVLDPLPGLLEL
ncbi:MAG: ribosome maturation factor RimM [Geodermatophilaceae bacterium]|nr:ribosome maturation factor RimM [Geodermatophilaceae bacterium]